MEKIVYLKIIKLNQANEEAGAPEVIHISAERMPKDARYNTPLDIVTDNGETVHCKILGAQAAELCDLNKEDPDGLDEISPEDLKKWNPGMF